MINTRKLLLIMLVGLACLMIVVGCNAHGVNSRQKIVDSKPPSKIETLIKQLGDDDFKVRDSAQKELTELGEKLVEQYRQTKSDTDKDEIANLARLLHEGCEDKDMEIRMRASQIRRYLYSLTSLKISFISTQGIYSVVYIMDVGGENLQELMKTKAVEMSFAWSPDGAKIAFTSEQDDNDEIYVIDVNSKKKKRLTKNNVQDNGPAWSPDGTKIAFTSGERIDVVTWEIYVMDADGKNHSRLTENQARDSDPAWSPDGTKIAFASDRDGKSEIYVMDVNGKNPKRLTDNEAWFTAWPTWSPDGTKIAFTSISMDEGISDIYVIDADGGNQRNLTKHEAYDYSSAWSPDSTKIAFVSERDDNIEIYVMDADGKNVRRLTRNTAYNTSPAWYPIAFPEISVLFTDKEENKDK